MENAVDSLKMILGIMIFLFGLAIFFNMASQARETASILISQIDKTKYYDYVKNEGTIDNNGNRIVELKDIIPTLYRYHLENFGVTIIDKSGNIVARFDLDTETMCNNWQAANSGTKDNFITETNNVIKKVNNLAGSRKVNELNTDRDSLNNDSIITLFKKIYAQNTSDTIRRDYYCAWIGNTGWIEQRIGSDISRI